MRKKKINKIEGEINIIIFFLNFNIKLMIIKIILKINNIRVAAGQKNFGYGFGAETLLLIIIYLKCFNE
jgi:hypothetical protein